jgi:hypothetical protein
MKSMRAIPALLSYDKPHTPMGIPRIIVWHGAYLLRMTLDIFAVRCLTRSVVLL